MSKANLTDIKKFIGGTMKFTFDGNTFIGTIARINYVLFGSGGINVTLLSVTSTSDMDLSSLIPDIPLDFTFSLMIADVDDTKPREIIINFIFPLDHFGKVISFRMRD